MKLTNILVISPFFYPHKGGSQIYMEELYIQIAKSHPEIKVDILCYNTDDKKLFENYRGLNIYRIPTLNILPGQFALPSPLVLINFLVKNHKKYQIIHCNTRFFDSSWWAPLYAKLIGVKVFLTDHCGTHPVHQNSLISLASKFIDLTIVRFFIQFYDRVFSENTPNKSFLKSIYGINSEVIYGGADLQVFKPSKDKKLQVLFVGRLIDSKGAGVLFNVAKALSEVKFLFVGGGELIDQFKEEIRIYQTTHIEILGELEKEKVASLMSKSEIFVHPSFHHDGLALSLIEAGASKMAVIATDSGATRELIQDQTTGLIIAKNDPISLKQSLEILINDRNLREGLANNLYRKVKENFGWDKISDQYYKEIESFL